MKKDDFIEKAKWAIGEQRTDGKGVVHECYGYTADGKPQIRRVKKQHVSATQPTSTTTSKTPAKVDDTKQAAPTKVDNTPKKTVPYDAPKPKVVYTKHPAPEVEVAVQVPETFKIKGKDGKPKDAKRDVYRKLYAQMDDDAKLLRILNNVMNDANMRMLAWEEAQARGIDESKVNVAGSLQRKWDKAKSEYDYMNKKDTLYDDETYTTFNTAILDTFDVDAVKKLFPEGDKGWRNKNDDRIKETFNNLKTKADRQKYDAFKDLMKREEKYYEPWQEVLQDLGRDYLMFIRDNVNSLFVSTGGAGAGKSYTLQKIFELDEKQPYTGGNPSDNDYDYVMLANDVQDENDFRKILHDFNGKIIVFDDKDKLLNGRSQKLTNMMKALGDTNPKLRKFKSPSGQDEVFTGKLIFISNKSDETLNRDEDIKAVMTRAIKNKIDFTVNENLEVLSNRYMDMEPEAMADIKADDPKLEKEYRQKAFDIIMDMSDKLDPMTFSVRKFRDIMFSLNADYMVGKENKKNEDFAKYIGNQKDFERIVVTELEKSIGNEPEYFEKAVFTDEWNSITDAQKEVYKKLYKKNPEEFVKLFGKEIIDIINGDAQPIDKSDEDEKKPKTDEEVKKAFEEEFGDMTLQEAENILFS